MLFLKRLKLRLGPSMKRLRLRLGLFITTPKRTKAGKLAGKD
jgi:hypothetical protein